LTPEATDRSCVSRSKRVSVRIAGMSTWDAPEELSPRERRQEQRNHLHREERSVQLIRAGIVGIAAGLLAVLYQVSVTRVESIGRIAASYFHGWSWQGECFFVLLTGLFGAAISAMIGRYAPESGGSGIPHIKAALLHLRTIKPIRLIVAKFLGGLGALMIGMSMGREGPTVQMGASVGKLVGDVLRVPKRSRDSLLAAGAGAGLAAAFNAPLAGFLFVMEELKREMSAITYGSALVASVCAVAVTRYLMGQHPSFLLTSPGGPPLRVLPQVAVLGVVAGIAGVLFNKFLVGILEVRRKLRIPRWLMGLVVGSCSGLALIFWPPITGVGHNLVESVLSGSLGAPHLFLFVILLFAGKFVLTVGSYGTGLPGGIFAPILALGSLLGLAYGIIVHQVIPQTPFSPAGFATIGMTGMLAASVRAPLTGVVLIVEMTGEYSLLYSLLVGAFVADLVAGALRDQPIYEALMERDLKLSGAQVSPDEEPILVEVLVEPRSTMDGRRVKDLHLPPGAILATLERGSRHVVPGGSTVLRAGDMVTMMIEGDKPDLSLFVHEASKSPS